MSHSLKPFLCLLLCLLQFLTATEQNLSDYNVVNYNSDNGLPQNSINGMAFDKNGFLWLATEMGMLRFDGKNFREYNTGNAPILLSNRFAMTCMTQQPGKINIESLVGKHPILTVTNDYQLQEDAAYTNNPYLSHHPNNYIFSYANLFKKIAASDTGTYGGLFYRLDLNGDLHTVNEMQAYVVKDQQSYYLDEAIPLIRPLPELTGHALKVSFIVGNTWIFIDRQNQLFAYKEGHLQKNITGSAQLMKLLSQVDVTGPYPIQAALKVMRDPLHTLLTYKGSVFLLNIQNGIVNFETLVTNTGITNFNCLIYDQQYKTMYIGTATSGLYILKKREFKRLFFTSDNYIINSLYAQTELPDGDILTSSGVLSNSGKINIPTPGIYDRPAFLRSSDGYIWYSSYRTLLKMDTNLRNPITIGTIGYWLVSILETPDKDILLCNPGKLFRVRENHLSLLYDDAIKRTMHGAEMQVIQLISPTELWIGTALGLFSYNLSNDAISSVPGMEKSSVRTIYKAKDGSIWIGTYGQGFYKYEKGTFHKMPTDPEGNLSNVHCFMEDHQGYFWLPTNKGLYKVSKMDLDRYASGDKENVFLYYFDKSSGFATNEFDGGCTPCGIATRDGRFSLPSLDGLIQFYPDSIKIVPPDHPIFIDHYTPDKVLVGDYFEQEQNAGPLAFAISSPYFGNAANLTLEYTIPELDNKWHPVAKDGKLVLTGLHKGSFTLTIRKQEGYARYSYNNIRWTILPFWYETIWFNLLIVIIIVSILFCIFWLRYTQQLKRAKLLEQKVTERTQALSESNRVKEKMIAIILHDLRSPLRFLHMLSNHIYEHYQKMSPPSLDEILLKFKSSTQELYTFAQDFLLWITTQKEGFVIQQKMIVLHEIVDEIVSLYEPGANIQHNTVLNLVPPSIVLTSDSNILKLLIRNITDNANKYTVNGVIKIEAFQEGNAISITITDTGDSMEKEVVDAIINGTYQTYNDSQGLGYKFIIELLARIGGELSIDAPGKTGNRITLLFRIVKPVAVRPPAESIAGKGS